jgi:hypothetical protein
MSSRSWLLRTGSNVSVVGWFEPVAQSIARFRTWVNSRPFQYDTAIEAGSTSGPPVVK